MPVEAWRVPDGCRALEDVSFFIAEICVVLMRCNRFYLLKTKVF